MNQFRTLAFFALISIIVSCSSCKDEKPDPIGPTKMTISFLPKWHGNALQLQQVYNDAFGNRIRIDKFMNYVSMLTLVKEDGTELMLQDFMLNDFFYSNNYTYDVPAAKYTSVKFNLGIPESYNKDQDPAQYPSSSPLSVAGSQGMFWTWNTGYIFSKFEAKCDTTGTEGAELLWPVAIHAGDDFCLRSFNSGAVTIDVTAGNNKQLNIIIDVDKILEPGGDNDIDLATDAITHTSTNTELANMFMDNYLNAISISQ